MRWVVSTDILMYDVMTSNIQSLTCRPESAQLGLAFSLYFLGPGGWILQVLCNQVENRNQSTAPWRLYSHHLWSSRTCDLYPQVTIFIGNILSMCFVHVDMVFSFTGSSQNLNQLDPVRRMNLQEDARSRRISAEIMKHRLYESVITSPRRRRLSVRADYMGVRPADEIAEMQSFQYTSRMAQSLPVTPAHSQNVTPIQSPTSSRRFFFGFFSRGTTPEEDDRCLHPAPPSNQDSWKGLASIFKPSPRCIPVVRAPSITDMREDNEDIENRLQGPNVSALYPQKEDGVCLNTPPRVRPGKNGPCPVVEKDLNTELAEDM